MLLLLGNSQETLGHNLIKLSFTVVRTVKKKVVVVVAEENRFRRRSLRRKRNFLDDRWWSTELWQRGGTLIYKRPHRVEGASPPLLPPFLPTALATIVHARRSPSIHPPRAFTQLLIIAGALYGRLILAIAFKLDVELLRPFGQANVTVLSINEWHGTMIF